MSAKILNITVDCIDARAQATFWAAVTGWNATIQDLTEDHIEYSVDPPDGSLPRLYFTTVPESKRAKNRLHLDLLPPGDDHQAELVRLQALGARVLADQPRGVSWTVLADPEGNEFCLEG